MLRPATGHSSPVTESANLSLILVTFVLGLIIDQSAGLAGQFAVGAWTWGVFFLLPRTNPREWRLAFYACLVWATAGEIFLSLVWGLYAYRLGNIPLFIPPGHVLLFYLGLVLAPRVAAGLRGAGAGGRHRLRGVRMDQRLRHRQHSADRAF